MTSAPARRNSLCSCRTASGCSTVASGVQGPALTYPRFSSSKINPPSPITGPAARRSRIPLLNIEYKLCKYCIHFFPAFIFYLSHPFSFRRHCWSTFGALTWTKDKRWDESVEVWESDLIYWVLTSLWKQCFTETWIYGRRKLTCHMSSFNKNILPTVNVTCGDDKDTRP